MSEIKITVGEQAFSLDGNAVELTVKEALLAQHPELGAALADAGSRANRGLDFAPKKTADGRYLNYIDGAWVEAAESSAHYDNINPAHTDQSLGRVPETPASEVTRACEAAERDFEAWRRVSNDIKTKLFLRIADSMTEHLDTLSEIMTREMGKSFYDSKLDVLEAIGVVESVAPQSINMKGVTYSTNIEGLTMETRLSPRGVAGIITPFNFPVAIPLAQVMSALATSNTVVWKPSHLTPECSHAIVIMIEDAFRYAKETWNVDVPKGVFHMVQGDADAGDVIVRDPRVLALSFTGSKAVGDQVDAIASGLGKRVMKECGGINMYYVHKDANLERAARNFVYGKTITAGQRCTSIQQVLIDEEVYDAFAQRAIELATAGVVTGDGLSEELAAADADTNRFGLAPLISGEQRDRVAGLVEQSVSEGARIRFQKEISPELMAEGNYFPFTMVEDADPDNVLSRTEIFGPVGVLRRVSGLQEAIRIINGTIGIVGCIDTMNKDVSETFIDRVLRTRIDDGRHGTGCFWATKFGGDRGAGSGNPALDEDMVYGYCVMKTIYRSFSPVD